MLQNLQNLNRRTEPSRVEESVNRLIVSDRVERLRYYLVIWVALWGFFGVYYYVNDGFTITTLITAAGVGLNCIFFWLDRKRWFSRQSIANLFIGCSVAGIAAATVTTGQYASEVPFLFPIICMVAAQLLGMRIATSWFLLCAPVSFLCYWIPVYGTVPDSVELTHRLINDMCFSFAMLCLSDQAERFFVKRTVHLHSLTESLQEKSRLLNLAEETAGVGHWHWNLETDEVNFSDELIRICSLRGARNRQLTMETLVRRFDGEHATGLTDALRKGRESGVPFTIDLQFEDLGETRYVMCRGLCERDRSGTVQAIFGVLREDTLLKQATERLSKKATELKRLASFDTLTGLTNRFQFRRHLNRSVTRSSEKCRSMALLVLDMDGFKEINDTLGHATGDLVLQETARRLKSVVSSRDVVSRLGGDEFTVILRDVKTSEDVMQVGERIVDAIRQPMTFDNTSLTVGSSVGASVCPRDTMNPDELFTFADTAMYHAKFNGLDVAMYESGMTAELIERKRVESKLIHALERDEFHVVYQPQYSIDADRIIGFEALMRWTRDGSIVSPMDFIPLLETTGQIIEVGQWILDQACQQLETWTAAGYRTRVAVNISPVQFRDTKFIDRVIETISKYAISAELIDLEITEGVLIADVEQTAKTLDRLKQIGCRISVDDFGTGYSSLAYLKNFPIDQLKIDRTFIKDFPEHDDGSIATSIIVLGLSLDMEVLAEGVETQEQLDFLRSQECQAYQGNLRSVPVAANECGPMLIEAGIRITDSTPFEDIPQLRQTVDSI